MQCLMIMNIGVAIPTIKRLRKQITMKKSWAFARVFIGLRFSANTFLSEDESSSHVSSHLI